MRSRVLLTEQPLDVAAIIAAAGDPTAGAVSSFVGTVRNSSSVASSGDRMVTALVYEAHVSLAERRLEEIVDSAVGRWDLASAILEHRLGECALGEPTVAIACGAAHREEAFDACRWIIEELKKSVPIWKREVYEDGSSWVGMGS